MNNKNNLIFILDFWERGGATQFIVDEATRHKGQNILISGELPEIHFNKRKYFSIVRLFTVYFRYFRLFVFFRIAYKSFVVFNHILPMIKKENSYLIGNLPFSSLGVFLHPKARNFKKDYVFHGAFDLEQSSLFENNEFWSFSKFKLLISTRIFFLVQKKVLQLSDRVIVFSDYSKKIVIEHFNVLPEKIFKVSPQLITPQNQKQKLLPEYFIQKNKSFILLVPSRIEPRKGLMILLESLLYLKKISNYKFDLFFTGEINNEQYAKEMFIFCKMNNLVEAHFINSVDKERLYELYKASDLVCMPSLKLETFGLVTLESISQGTPVVSFDTGATTELLSKIDKRLIASDVTAASLADTILWYFRLSSTDKTRLRKKCKVFFSKYKCSKNTFLSLYYK